ncbi:MAG: AtpZ/AtpI family protein [Longimicrobiales bacterium]
MVAPAARRHCPLQQGDVRRLDARCLVFCHPPLFRLPDPAPRCGGQIRGNVQVWTSPVRPVKPGGGPSRPLGTGRSAACGSATGAGMGAARAMGRLRNFSQAFTFAASTNEGVGVNNVEKESQRQPDGRSGYQSIGQYLGHGLTLAASTLLFLWLGTKADDWLGTEPWLALLGAFLGAGAGFYHMYHHLVEVPRNEAGEDGSG